MSDLNPLRHLYGGPGRIVHIIGHDLYVKWEGDLVTLRRDGPQPVSITLTPAEQVGLIGFFETLVRTKT